MPQLKRGRVISIVFQINSSYTNKLPIKAIKSKTHVVLGKEDRFSARVNIRELKRCFIFEASF